MLVTAASVSDTAAAVTLLSRIATAHPHLTKAWGDAGYRTTAIDHGARLGIDVRPSTARPAPAGSPSSQDGGPPSAASAGSCTTGASPATANATRTAPRP